MHRYLALGVFLAVLLVASLLGYFYFTRTSPEDKLPAIELAGADPAVAKAIEKARVAVEEQPQSAKAWGKLGMVLFAHDYLAEGLLCLERAEHLDANDVRWPYYQGLILMRERPTEAAAPLERAAQRAGRDPVAWLRLGEALLSQDRLEQAEPCFRRVLRADNDNPRAQLGLGIIARRRGELKDCIERLERAAASPLARRDARVALAEAHLQLGNTETAARLQAELPGLGKDAPWPDDMMADVIELQTGTRARLNRVNGLLNAGRVPDAVLLIKQILRDDPTSDLANMALGRALWQQRDYVSTEKAMAEATRLRPEFIDAHLLRADALLMLERTDEAIASCRAAIKLNPAHALAYYSLSRCLRKKDDRRAAQAALRDTLRCRPDFAPAHIDLAVLLKQDGKTTEALTHLRAALQVQPDDERAKKMMAELEKKAN
jgi:tetratricopeptide (TPR) repeat protein